jgi:hypothetical protein
MLSFLKKRTVYSIKELEHALDQAVHEARKERTMPQNEDAISNVILSIKISIYDLNLLLDDSVRHKDLWRQRLYARMLVVSMAAFFDSYNDPLGRMLREALGRNDALSSLQQRMRRLLAGG